jgi:hypothetical protein
LPIPTRRAALGALAAVPALALPAVAMAGSVEVDPELSELIAQWHESHRLLLATHDAFRAADNRAECPTPPAFIATEGDASHWWRAVAGRPFKKDDVDALRGWLTISRLPESPIPHLVIPDLRICHGGRIRSF